MAGDIAFCICGALQVSRVIIGIRGDRPCLSRHGWQSGGQKLTAVVVGVGDDAALCVGCCENISIVVSGE